MAFQIDWILKNELAVGPAPTTKKHIMMLQAEGINCLLSLCSTEEASPPEEIKNFFRTDRFVLPDHKSGRAPTADEIKIALDKLINMSKFGSVYVHCFAGIERSPLICMAYLIKIHHLTSQQALDYLMEMHAGTNPLPSQFKVLNFITQNINNK